MNRVNHILNFPLSTLNFQLKKMLIGQDYPKIEFELFGLDLVEPNAFIGDLIIFLVALYYYFKVKKQELNGSDDFLKNWRLFYLWFGISFLCGGFGHVLYNYTGVMGKTPSWFLGLLAPYFIEQAMLSIYPNVSRRKLFRQISTIKLVVFALLELVILCVFDISDAPEKGLLLPTLSTTAGLFICLGILGFYYQRKLHPSFKYLWYAMIVLILSAIPQAMKINIHQYWDRNDVSHIFLLLALVLYYQTIRHYRCSSL